MANEIDTWVKRPVIVQAIRLLTPNDTSGLWPDCDVRINRRTDRFEVYDKLHDTWVGFQPGDWIIRGINGEYYPCAHDVFIRSYQREVYTHSRDGVLPEVRTEMDKQVTKWGEQNWASKHGIAANYLGHDSEYYKNLTDDLAKAEMLTWADILLEEVAEALDADNIKDVREELIQVAAVTGSWVESIDRNGR